MANKQDHLILHPVETGRQTQPHLFQRAARCFKSADISKIKKIMRTLLAAKKPFNEDSWDMFGMGAGLFIRIHTTYKIFRLVLNDACQ